MASTVSTAKTACVVIICAVGLGFSAGSSAPPSLGSNQLRDRSDSFLVDPGSESSAPESFCTNTSEVVRLMYLKKGVDLRGLRPEIIPALLILSNVTGGDFVVTSATDAAPNRIPTSLHPKGLAIDVRIPDHAEQDAYRASFKETVADAFADTQFDLVWYEKHVHIEFDPK